MLKQPQSLRRSAAVVLRNDTPLASARPSRRMPRSARGAGAKRAGAVAALTVEAPAEARPLGRVRRPAP